MPLVILGMAKAQQGGGFQAIDVLALVESWPTLVVLLEKQSGLLLQHHPDAMELLQPITELMKC